MNYEFETMIDLRNVSKSFGSLQVLQPTSLQVTPGRCTVLIGPSGCGKSTLLRLMIGLIEPDTGEILFDGELERRQGRFLTDCGRSDLIKYLPKNPLSGE